MTIETSKIPYLKAVDKVVIIVDLMIGAVPAWAATRDDLPILISALTDMEEKQAREAVKIAEEKKLIKYFSPSDDE